MDYHIEDGVLVNASGNDSEIVIPGNVEKIGWNSFKKRSGLRKVIIPPNVKCIELTAFVDCKDLTVVVIQGDSVNLEGRCFSRCKKLNKVIVQGSISQIGWGCFEECTNLYSINIPVGLVSIGDLAFYGCKKLDSITIPEGVRSIGKEAFYGCKNIKTVSLPSTLTIIGEEAFNDTGLEEVRIVDLKAWCKVDFKYPANHYTNMMFGNANKLYINNELVSTVVIPSGVEEIRRGPFSGFSNIKILEISEGVTTIKKCAFSDWRNHFEKIFFPASLKTIEYDTMLFKIKVKEIHIASIQSWCEMRKVNLLFDGTPEYCFDGKIITDIVVPEGTRVIGSGVFARVKSLTSVRIPKGLETIEDYAFYGCTNLTVLYFPSTLQQVKESAFLKCTSIKEVHIPSRKAWSLISFGPKHLSSGDDGNPLNYGAQLIIDNAGEQTELDESPTTVTIDREVASLSGQAEIQEIILSHKVKKIDNFAFQDCAKLKRIRIPKSVTRIGWNPFVGCPELEEVHIEDLTSWLMTSFGDIDTNLYGPQTKLFLNEELITELIIPAELHTFEMNFRGYSYLTKVVFQEGNLVVPMYSFKDESLLAQCCYFRV